MATVQLPPSPAPSRVRPARAVTRRLVTAFEALEGLPALETAHRRFGLALERMERNALLESIYSDTGLALAVLRDANRRRMGTGPAVVDVSGAIAVLGRAGLYDIHATIRRCDLFEPVAPWGPAPVRYGAHARLVQSYAWEIGAELGWRDSEHLLVTGLLHDVGKLVMGQAYAGYPELVHAHSATPEERLLRERRRFGVDHATLGGAALRKLSLPAALARTVAGHHEDGAAGAAGIVRLADALAHHHAGGTIALDAVSSTAARVGVGRDVTRALLSDLPSRAAPRLGALDCPLSSRELEVLRRLAEGAVYAEIAGALGVSDSTVRSHLGNVYRKLEVRDRAQAVLLAADNGWL